MVNRYRLHNDTRLRRSCFFGARCNHVIFLLRKPQMKTEVPRVFGWTTHFRVVRLFDIWHTAFPSFLIYMIPHVDTKVKKFVVF